MSKQESDTIIHYEVPHRGGVEVSLNEATWPCRAGDVGFVPHWAVMPDPRQPRRKEDFNQASLQELGANIKINGQAEVMKVRCLTADERENCPPLSNKKTPVYLLVSGERRWRALAPEIAAVPIVEIRVAVYVSEAAQHLDAFVINDGREDLPPLSRAASLLRILNENCEGSVAKLCKVVGRSRLYVETYLRLNNLIPEACALLDPNLLTRQQMTVGIAAEFAKLSHEHQSRYLVSLTNGEAGRTMRSQMRWLEDQLVRDEGEQASFRTAVRKDHPIEIRQRIQRLLDLVRIHGKQIMGNADKPFTDGFRNLTGEECLILKRQFEDAKALLGKVEMRFEQAVAHKQTFADRNKDLLPGWKVVDYYISPRDLRTKQSVSPSQYLKLREQGKLRWQVEGAQDPDAIVELSS